MTVAAVSTKGPTVGEGGASELVWLVESGEYEQRGVDCVAALAYIKGRYGPPYIVEWEVEPASDDGSLTLTGHFTAVQHYSTQHTAYYDITAIPLRTEGRP